MMKLYEKGILKKDETLVVLAIRKGKIQKDKKKLQGAKGKNKGKNKRSYAPKAKISPPPKRDNPAKDSICQHCKEVGHWRRNCPSYQAELKKRKNASVASTSGFVGTHICNTSQGLRESRKLKRGALSLYMGNGMRAAVEAIRSFDLILPSGLIIVIDNCHFAPTVTRGVVSISSLVNNDMHNLYPNVCSMYNVSNKRAKHALDAYYLWHYRLGHINKKRMDMFQRDGILQPAHDESHEKCKSCISRKMTRKTFPHQVERAKDLLGLIHIDVCGPFRTVSREGANYFITFTDDFTCYGFVYLMKHKHEVFETFKIFQNEVKNQLGRKIKAIRSDRGGEYLSYEFVNHMKSCENAARILNMVPTKKVVRTPYEIWHRKAPKLSYLRVWGCYPKQMMGYYFYYPFEKKNFVSRNAEFFENSFMVQEASGSHGLLEMSGSDKGLELIQEEDTQPSENTSEAHNKVAPINYDLGIFNEPPNYKVALADPESNQVWYLVDLPSNYRTIGCKWLFKKKTDMDDNVHTFKAHLVANGFTQTYGVDYGETFSPIADIRAIRIFVAIFTFYDYEIWQIDVKTTFLNGHLSEDVYMVQLEGFDEEIKKIGFTQNPDKPCVYLKASGSNVVFIVLYVDDILLMGNSVTMLQEVKSWLCSIMYAVRCTRLDVAFAQNLCSRFQQNPGEIHWTPVKTILKYLRNTKNMVLVYGEKPEDELKVSSVDWKSAKQSTTAMSSTEAEYVVAAEASMEAVWMRKLIDGLGDVMSLNKRPMEMLCDNEPALAIASDPRILKGARHF
ncbi:retrotransposon protein, putative, ty1-copia subclass [Tanacetum coccineum]